MKLGRDGTEIIDGIANTFLTFPRRALASQGTFPHCPYNSSIDKGEKSLKWRIQGPWLHIPPTLATYKKGGIYRV